MAKIANRSDATQKNKNHWDASSHAFTVILPQKADELKMRSSCDACHEGTDRVVKGSTITQGQNEIKTKIVEVETAIASTKGEKATQVAKLLAEVKNDRSLGAHNPQKSFMLLNEAGRIISMK
jgi:hypothetical protein